MDVKDDAVQNDVHRALEELRRLIRYTGMSQREVEQRAGFSRGYLSQLLAHNMDLKLWHVLAILRALDYSPRRFFAELFVEPYDSALEIFRRQSQPVSGELAATLERLYPDVPGGIRQLHERVEQCEKAIAELRGRRGRRSRG